MAGWLWTPPYDVEMTVHVCIGKEAALDNMETLQFTATAAAAAEDDDDMYCVRSSKVGEAAPKLPSTHEFILFGYHPGQETGSHYIECGRGLGISSLLLF